MRSTQHTCTTTTTVKVCLVVTACSLGPKGILSLRHMAIYLQTKPSNYVNLANLISRNKRVMRGKRRAPAKGRERPESKKGK